MIRLQRSMLAGLNTTVPDTAAVIAALQNAVELEHATIPTYLYSLYSLDEAKNAAIAEIIESVVFEEMLHMTLASNVLNALGGDSEVGNPRFVPSFPGPLPGGVESELVVHLAPFSMAQLQTFLTIEQPEDALQFPVKAAVEAEPITIGQFYTSISEAIGKLGDAAFVKPPRHQVGPDLMDGSLIVSDVATAQQALAIIIDQGEGTSTSPEEIDGDNVAHYYRFMQIEKGKLLIPTPGQPPGWAYAGAPLPFDPSGVYAVQTDPNSPPNTYPPGSAEAFANDNFNYTYTSLLLALRELFSGHNDTAQMNRAIGLMMSLKGQAKAMMAGIPNPAVLTGPSFQYQPVNPAQSAP